MPRARTLVFIFVAIAVGLYYRWGVHAAGGDFRWGQDGSGYYNFLARGFAGGHLYLPLEVSPELLAQPDPWDPDVDNSLKLFDAALFNKHYYLYHGAGPAVMFFLPWRLITHHDLPENYASFLLCFGGYLFSAGALLALLRLAGKEPGAFATGVSLMGLGFCQGVPFLLNRTWVYEIAIAGGYVFVSAAVYFVLRGLNAANNKWWMAASGFACGLAIASRPHMGLFAMAIAAVLLLRARRSLIAFAIPLALAGIAIGIYNFERFGNPAEFGIRYLLTGKNQNRIKLNVSNIAPVSFYLLASAPETDAFFPWVRMAWPPKRVEAPKEFFLEPSVGAVWLAPFLPGLFLLPMLGRARLPALLIAGASAGVFLFVALTGWSTQRYEVDFLPMLVLPSLAAVAALRSVVATALVAVLVLAGSVVNLAIAVSGPVDDIIHWRPDRYVRLSRMLTPEDRYRLRLNPPFSFTCQLPSGGNALDVLSLGSAIYRYDLSYDGESFWSRRRFDSEARASAGDAREVTVSYEPSSQEIVVAGSGEERLRHRIGSLTAAPAELESACGGRAKISSMP